MKKYIKAFCSLLCGAYLLTGCEKELMSYEGEDCLYFDVRRGSAWISPTRWAHQYFSAVSFGNLIENEVQVSYKIMSSGMPKDYDRPFTVTINNDSTTAEKETDFKGFKENYVIKAGETSALVSFTVYRTKKINNDTLQLQLQLHANEYFNLNYTTFGKLPNTYDPDGNPKFAINKNAAVHNIFMYDVLSRPAVWSGNDISGGGLFGKFSATKFKLMMKLSNTTTNDYTSTATMPSARQNAIAELVSRHLLEKATANDPVLDEDGTMMYFMPIETLGGSAAWSPFTKPEDYYSKKP